MTDSEWKANGNEFAVRVRPENMKAWFSKGINVDESQTGLLFESGRFQHELTPGRQKLELLPETVRRWITGETASAVLIRRGLFSLSILGKALTPEGHEVSFDCEFGLQVGDRNTFYVNLMQSTDQVTAGDLMQRFGGVARQAIFSVIGRCGSAELLNVHPELQQRLVDAVTDAIVPVATRWGMAVGYVSPPAFSNKQLAAFQQERAQMVRELWTEKLQQQFAEDKDKIEIRRFQAARVLDEAKMKDAIEQAERTGEFDKVRAELGHSKQLHGLQLTESMDAAVDTFAARRRERSEKNQDHASLRVHLLAVTDIERQRQLATLKFEFRKQSLLEQHQIDDLVRVQKIEAARQEMLAEVERLKVLQDSQIDRWVRLREVQRTDRVAEATADTTATQITADAEREKRAKDAAEALRQRAAGHTQTVTETGELSELQIGRLTGLVGVQKMQNENKAAEERAKHELTEDAKEREHKRKLEEWRELNGSSEMMQMLKLAELAVQSPAMSSAFGEAMRIMMFKGMTGEQLEQVMSAQSPDVASALQEKYRTQAEVAKAQAATVNNGHAMQRECLERIISELKSSRDISGQQMADVMDRLERTGLNSQQMLKDVGVASGSRVERSDNSVDPRLVERLMERMMDMLRKLE